MEHRTDRRRRGERSRSTEAGEIPHVVIITQFYWPERIGSAPYVTDLAEWFVERGARVTVVTARPHYPDYAVHADYRDGQRDDEVRNGVEIRRMPTPSIRRTGAAGRILLESALAVQGLWRLARGKLPRAERVVTLCPSVLFVGLGRLAVRRGGTHVALVHDIQSGLAEGLGMVRNPLLKRLMVASERLFLNMPDRVAVLTREMGAKLREQGVRAPTEVIPIWVDIDAIRPQERRHDAALTVLYAGNLGRKQGLDQVIDAATVLSRTDPEVKIVIRGEGSRREALIARARELELTNVEFRGLVPPEALGDSLADADLHIVPQAASGADFAVPSKAYNILAAGRPFVATANPGTSLHELAARTDAFVCVPPDRPEALARAVSELLRDAERRRAMADRGRRFAEDEVARQVVLSRLGRHLGIPWREPEDRLDIVPKPI